jgi:hypothetical protein
MKITKSFLQKLIQEEVRNVLREQDITDPARVGMLGTAEADPSLPVDQKIELKNLIRRLTDPGFLQGVVDMHISGQMPGEVDQGDPNLSPEKRQFAENAQLLKIMVRDHPLGEAGGMEALNAALQMAMDSGALRSPGGSGVSPAEIATAIKTIVNPAGQESSRARINKAARTPGMMQESRDVSRQLQWRRGVHPVAQRKNRRRR